MNHETKIFCGGRTDGRTDGCYYHAP
jgi:hypothetical protein